jgi:VWFA-related protein
MKHRLLACAALTALSTSLLAYSQSIFRSETNYIEISAVVTDKSGNVVTDLKPADFEVIEQRQVQKISTFGLVDLTDRPGLRSSAPARLRQDLLQPERPLPDRIFLLYVTDSTTARERATEFVRDFMQPNDVAAAWLSNAPGPATTFTQDKLALLRVIAPYPLATNDRTPPTVDRQREQREGRQNPDNWLSGVQGRRKSVILFSDRGGSGPSAAGAADGFKAIIDRPDVHLYLYDVRGLTTTPPGGLAVGGTSPITGLSSTSMVGRAADNATANARSQSDASMSMRLLADRTGGLTFLGSKEDHSAFTRIVEDNSHYYVVGYYSPKPERDGTRRSLTVRVKRANVKVRTRDGYVAR